MAGKVRVTAMMEPGNERITKVSETANIEFPQDVSSSSTHPCNQDLLLAVIILGIIVFVLIVIIIYGYFKYVRGRKTDMENPPRERSSNMRESPGGVGQESLEVAGKSIPVKMRKRSMTFTETDEECRKYREDLADSYDKLETEDHSRKKSVVKFVGVDNLPE